MKNITVNEGDTLVFEDGRRFTVMSIQADIDEPQVFVTAFDERHEPVEDMVIYVEPGFVSADATSSRRALCGHREWHRGRCVETSCWNHVNKHADG